MVSGYRPGFSPRMPNRADSRWPRITPLNRIFSCPCSRAIPAGSRSMKMTFVHTLVPLLVRVMSSSTGSPARMRPGGRSTSIIGCSRSR